MQSSLALSLGLPVTLFIVMLGLGLSLRLEDFSGVFARPKPLLVGLVCQILLLPVLCLGLVWMSDLPPAVAVGMMLLAASPAGSSAALFTHLAKGDVALSLCLAAITSALAMLTLPAAAGFSLELFYGEAKPVQFQALHILQIFAIAFVPALIGALIRRHRPNLSLRLERPIKTLATLFLVGLVLVSLVGQWGVVIEWGPVAGTTVLTFNLVSLAVAYWVPRLLNVERRQAIALAMGIGIHNAALVITMALSEFMLDNPEMAIAPALYGVLAYLTCGAFVWLLNRTRTAVA